MVGQAAMASFFFLVAAILAVGLVSWFRTAPLRRGTVPQARDPPAEVSCSTSVATLLAAMAGVAAAIWGAVTAGEGQRTTGVLLALAGIFVGIAGTVARVVGFRATAEGLVVLFARRKAFAAPWREIAALRPPLNPLGGWRITTVGGGRTTLMPSDLLGTEALLDLIILCAGMCFDGRTWSRDVSEPAVPEPPRTGCR
jgi:hypothetical protein